MRKMGHVEGLDTGKTMRERIEHGIQTAAIGVRVKILVETTTKCTPTQQAMHLPNKTPVTLGNGVEF